MQTIDLSGPEGNAFHLMGLATKWGKQLDMDTNDILLRMQSGDYDNLVDVFEEAFSNVVTIER